MRETRAETLGKLERRGTRSRQKITEFRLLTRGAEGVTSLVHALLVRRKADRIYKIGMIYRIHLVNLVNPANPVPIYFCTQRV
jgi:hypothetical protein